MVLMPFHVRAPRLSHAIFALDLQRYACLVPTNQWLSNPGCSDWCQGPHTGLPAFAWTKHEEQRNKLVRAELYCRLFIGKVIKYPSKIRLKK